MERFTTFILITLLPSAPMYTLFVFTDISLHKYSSVILRYIFHKCPIRLFCWLESYLSTLSWANHSITWRDGKNTALESDLLSLDPVSDTYYTSVTFSRSPFALHLPDPWFSYLEKQGCAKWPPKSLPILKFYNF